MKMKDDISFHHMTAEERTILYVMHEIQLEKGSFVAYFSSTTSIAWAAAWLLVDFK
jgi:hypothetical protein